LLDFSKIEAGLRSYKRDRVNLTELTRRVLESLDRQVRHNQFTVTSRLDGDVPVLIDEEAAVQALENLISNAMKYSPEHRDIVVEVVRADLHGVVRVTDRGIGIPARLQRKIFNKFFRIQTDAGSGPQGTGLGLAIVDHVMRGQGGFVRAVLRRAGGRPSGLETCRIGDIEVDFRTHQAHRAGQRIDFTAREFDLLRYLVGHTGQVVTREQILNQVWGYEESPTTRTIDN